MNQTPTSPDAGFLAAVLAGLEAAPRTLPCRYFYDLEGSLLFEQICELPEYYLTRAEDAILRERSDEIAAELPLRVDLVELGSGSARKTRRLLEALLRRQPALRYLPIDISADMLAQTSRDLSRDYPRLSVLPIAAEYAAGMARAAQERAGPLLVAFLGSNLGNFDLAEAAAFLGRIRAMLREGDHTLIGLDLRKDRALLEAAYDDAAGVTARFNLNLLRRINRELGGDFDLAGFRHRAFFNEEEGRVEMHLVSLREQQVTVAGRAFRFAAGETIHTENSYKYTAGQVRELGRAAGLELRCAWTDAERHFSLNLFRPL
jgi:L-histidine Nalpha-methyltransferase